MSERERFMQRRREEGARARSERHKPASSVLSEKEKFRRERAERSAEYRSVEVSQPTESGLNERERFQREKVIRDEKNIRDEIAMATARVKSLEVSEPELEPIPANLSSFDTNLLPKASSDVESAKERKWSNALLNILRESPAWGSRKEKPEIPMHVVVTGLWRPSERNVENETVSYSLPFKVVFLRLTKFGWRYDCLREFDLSAYTETYLGVPKDLPFVDISVGDSRDLCNVPNSFDLWTDYKEHPTRSVLPESVIGIDPNGSISKYVLEYFADHPKYGKLDNKTEIPVHASIDTHWMCGEKTKLVLKPIDWFVSCTVVFHRLMKNGWDEDCHVMFSIRVHTESTEKKIPPIKYHTVGNMREVEL